MKGFRIPWLRNLFFGQAWTRIPQIVRMDIREMWAGRPGPIHFEVSGTTINQTGDTGSAPNHPRNAHGADMPLPSKKQFKEPGHRSSSPAAALTAPMPMPPSSP